MEYLIIAVLSVTLLCFVIDKVEEMEEIEKANEILFFFPFLFCKNRSLLKVVKNKRGVGIGMGIVMCIEVKEEPSLTSLLSDPPGKKKLVFV